MIDLVARTNYSKSDVHQRLGRKISKKKNL
jgi:hypothetical protein